MIYTNPSRFKKTFESIDNWKIPNVEIGRLKTYIKDYMSGEVTGIVTEAPERNAERVIEFLKPSLVYFNKNIEDLTEGDIKEFYTALLRDEIKNFKGKPYVTTSKKRIYSTLKKYLEHHDIKLSIIKPLKKRIKIVKTSKDVITEKDLEKLCNLASENWQRYVHQVLFWGGLRASEFLGLKLKDISMPEDNKSDFVKIRIRRENTKSDAGERVITLYGENTLKAVRDYLEERKEEGLKENELIFNKKYDAIKSWLYRLSFRLKKPLHCHLYRHSCASLLCPSPRFFNGNMIKSCDFFGWEYNSPVVKTYIRRKRLDEADKVDEEISQNSLEDLRIQLSKEKQERSLLKEKYVELALKVDEYFDKKELRRNYP